MGLESLAKSLLELFEPKESLIKVSGGDILIGNLPRGICHYDGKPLELVFVTTSGLSNPRGHYYCSFCRTVYDLPIG